MPGPAAIIGQLLMAPSSTMIFVKCHWIIPHFVTDPLSDELRSTSECRGSALLTSTARSATEVSLQLVKRAPGGFYGAVHVLGCAFGNGPDDFLGGCGQYVDAVASGGPLPLAVNVVVRVVLQPRLNFGCAAHAFILR